jgi:arabinogalactan endo-1,4-beta-galactosidase
MTRREAGGRRRAFLACLGVALSISACSSSDEGAGSLPGRRPSSLWGIDANYVAAFEEAGRTWSVGGQRVDPLEELARRGARTFRLRIWVENEPGDEEPGTLERHARALARRAQAAGLYVIPTLFMSRGWGADTRQDAPSAWASLPVDDRAEVARMWAHDAVQQLLDDGLRTSTYGIGNETDYGFCGAFRLTDNVEELRAEVWPQAARLMKATIAGIEAATGRSDLEFILHIARGWDPDFAVAFFATMQQQGVPVSLAGLSYYPSDWGQERADHFEETVHRLHEELGLRVFIAEYAYPAEEWPRNCCDESPFCCANFCCCLRCALDGYELTETGQARFVADLRRRVHGDARFAGAVYWTPEEAQRPFKWSVMGLFQPSADGHAPGGRQALESF